MTRCAGPPAPTRHAGRRRSGASRRSRSNLDEVYRHLDTHVLFKLHWGGRGGKKGGRVADAAARGLPPRLERMWREQTYLRRSGRCWALPVLRGSATRSSCSTPRTAPRELDRLRLSPVAVQGERILPRPISSGRRWVRTVPPSPTGEAPAELDVVALQAVTVGCGGDGAAVPAGGRRRVRRAAVRSRPRRADRRGLAEWLH